MNFIDFINLFSGLGYWGIVVLMAIESTILPLPSELIIPPAGYLASLGRLDLFLVIIAGTLGSLIGALINYFLAATLGRAALYGLAKSRFGKLILLSPAKLEKAEQYFLRYGNLATFLGRLLPGTRHLISLPAGLVKMPLPQFMLYTALGAFIWSGILAVMGYTLGANATVWRANFDLVAMAGLGVLLLIVLWFLTKNLTKNRNYEN